MVGSPAEDDVVGLSDLLGCYAVRWAAGLAVGSRLPQLHGAHVVSLEVKHKQPTGHRLCGHIGGKKIHKFSLLIKARVRLRATEHTSTLGLAPQPAN